MAEYLSTSNHAEQIASGEMVPAYGTATLDPKEPHDAALLDAGTFLTIAKSGKPSKGDE